MSAHHANAVTVEQIAEPTEAQCIDEAEQSAKRKPRCACPRAR
jgi:hypothetical protein